GGPIPDVLTLQRRASSKRAPEGKSGIAVLTAMPQARFVRRAEVDAYARRADRIAIRHPLGHVVAVLEIVSPGNKDSRNALRAFVEKAMALLHQGIHLLV